MNTILFRSICWLVLIGLTPVFMFGQQLEGQQNYYQNEQSGFVYDREFSMDFKLQSKGFTLGAVFGNIKSYYKTSYLRFEFGEIKHPLEFRQNLDLQPVASTQVNRSFIYAKQNNLYVLRAGWGAKRYLSEKARKKGIAVGVTYEAGPTLGILKPYYLELRYYIDGVLTRPDIRSEKYSEENANKFLDELSIFGAAGFGEGLGELQFRPGAHGKVALHLDWGVTDEFIKALEVGLMLDVFMDKMPIMVENPQVSEIKNRPYFVNFFVALQLGKRH